MPETFYFARSCAWKSTTRGLPFIIHISWQVLAACTSAFGPRKEGNMSPHFLAC